MRNICSALVGLVITIVMAGCATSHINDKRINAAAFPPGVKDNSKILLVEKWTKGLTKGTVNRRIERSLSKHYTGKFEMATALEIAKDPKYANKDIYRYILSNQIWGSRSNTITSTPAGSSIQYNYAYRLDFHFTDRIDNRDYPDIGVTSNSFTKAIKRIGPVLNKRYL